MQKEFIGEIKKIVIEDGKKVAKAELILPKDMATKIPTGNVKVTIETTQLSMFDSQ